MVKEDQRPTSPIVVEQLFRQRNGITNTPRHEKRQRGKSADRVQQRIHGGRRMSATSGADFRNSPRSQVKILDRKQAVYHSTGGLSKSGYSFSSLNSAPSSSQIMGSTPKIPSPPGPNSSWYDKLLWSHQFDPKSKEEVVLNRRVGFYRFKSDLGAGNFSKVKLAHHQLTKEKVAVKIIDKSKLDSKTQKMVSREISIMDSLSHPNLIRLFEVTETVTGIYLMMEYAPGGELFVRLAEIGSFTELEARPIFAQIASAIQYMHERHFIHRDLKAENVFFAANYSSNSAQGQKSHKSNGFLTKKATSHQLPPNVQVKVGDFGFATQVNKIDQHLTTFCGSPPYAAPELFQDDHYIGPSVDIWALGILLYLMVTGCMPFKGGTVAELKKSILEGHFEVPTYLSSSCTELITSILKRKAEWRLPLQQIRECSWLIGVEWPKSDNKFRPLPMRPPFEESDLTPEEAKTREILLDIGIDEFLLESHLERGPRSHLIGAFRITQNKLLTEEQKESNVKDSDQSHSQDMTDSRDGKSTPKWWSQTSWHSSAHTRKSRDHSRSDSPKSRTSYETIRTKDVIADQQPNRNKKMHKNKSKLCLIL